MLLEWLMHERSGQVEQSGHFAEGIALQNNFVESVASLTNL
jgi:hypothetical protein